MTSGNLNSLSVTPVAAQPTPLAPLASTGSGNGFSFGDILDAVNPLQHIPVLSTLYRAATGSQISTASQVAGDTFYGALLPGGAVAGLASSLANAAVKAVSGKDIGQYVVGAVTSSLTPASAATPLVPIATASAAAPPAVRNPALAQLPSPANAQTSNSQYQRAQAFDAINNRLMKMAV